MSDSIDQAPSDHGSDRYGYVEVRAAGGIRPRGEWWDRYIARPCPDCNANVFAQHRAGDPWRGSSWYITIAHDDGCPWRKYEPPLPDSDEPGAPSAGVLLRAFTELTQRLSLTQDDLARYVGIGPATVMAWKRDRSIHPRHARVPALLSLWAAVSGAVEEFGEDETLRRVWASGKSGAAPALPADELAEQLIVAADEATRAEDEDDGYRGVRRLRPWP